MSQLKTTTAYHRIKKLNDRVRIVVGSAGSSKTYSILQQIIIYCLEQQKSKRILVVSQSFGHLKDGAIADLMGILQDMNLYKVSDHNKSDHTYKLGKCTITWIAGDEPHKFRGKRFDVAFFNEANNIPREVISQVMMRVREFAFMDLNPSHWGGVADYIEPDETNVLRLTFKDNEYLDVEVKKEYLKIIERAKTSEYWARQRDIYVYGIEAGVEGAVYNNWEIVPTRPENSKLRVHGADWGFSNDPSTHLSIYEVEADEPTLYLRENIYSPKLSNGGFYDLAKLVDGVFDVLTISDVNPLIVSELSEKGLPIKAAKKGAGSIQGGIQLVQGYKLLIDANSKNLIEELKKYQWETDKDENPLPVPKDKDNHLLDALRYGVTYMAESVGRRFCLKLIA